MIEEVIPIGLYYNDKIMSKLALPEIKNGKEYFPEKNGEWKLSTVFYVINYMVLPPLPRGCAPLIVNQNNNIGTNAFGVQFDVFDFEDNPSDIKFIAYILPVNNTIPLYMFKKQIPPYNLYFSFNSELPSKDFYPGDAGTHGWGYDNIQGNRSTSPIYVMNKKFNKFICFNSMLIPSKKGKTLYEGQNECYYIRQFPGSRIQNFLNTEYNYDKMIKWYNKKKSLYAILSSILVVLIVFSICYLLFN